eukprot:COSAG01_NODE_496_length_16290_cov_48.639244_14_plen_87_part_00
MMVRFERGQHAHWLPNCSCDHHLLGFLHLCIERRCPILFPIARVACNIPIFEGEGGECSTCQFVTLRLTLARAHCHKLLPPWVWSQ